MFAHLRNYSSKTELERKTTNNKKEEKKKIKNGKDHMTEGGGNIKREDN